MPFPRLWGEILQNSDGQKTTLWHIRGLGQCFCSTAWAWAPPFGPLWLGAPGFARSEPIVVTPLNLTSNRTYSLELTFQFMQTLLQTLATYAQKSHILSTLNRFVTSLPTSSNNVVSLSSWYKMSLTQDVNYTIGMSACFRFVILYVVRLYVCDPCRITTPSIADKIAFAKYRYINR
jgi:hypothetical protein